MADPTHKPALKWPKRRRFEEAIKACLDEGLSQRASSAKYGVSRTALGPKLAAAKVARQEAVDRAKATLAALPGAAAGPLGIDERRRVPPFWEFDRMYFGSWICPDCGTHHETPEFHHDIMNAVQSPSKRTLINTPPYHAKSTLITVKDTVYDLVCNPNSRTIIISKDTSLAQDFVGAIQNLLTNEEMYEDSERNLIEDWGPFKAEGQSQWNQSRLVLTGRITQEKDPSVLGQGWGRHIYGRRAEKIKFDDIADFENQSNPDQVRKMLGWIDKMALSRIGKAGKAIWVGTRVNVADIYSFLMERPNYDVVRFSCIQDESAEPVKMLWPEHFPYEQALIHRSEMTPSDFQLIYQNVGVAGVGATFDAEALEACKDTRRIAGHFDSDWRLVAGLDPAGAGKFSGFTAIVVLAIDLSTGARYLVWAEAHKAMKAHQAKDRILELTSTMPIYEWRVEGNGLQSQIFQYDQELVRELAVQGVRMVEHTTHKNKWDPQFGIESLAPLVQAGILSIPWANQQSQQMFQPLLEQMVAFPMNMGGVVDILMALWFADLGCRELLRRDHLPMFEMRRTRRWPARVRKRRHVVDFHNRTVTRIPMEKQRSGLLTPAGANYRRMMVGQPTPHGQVREEPEPDKTPYANVEGYVED